MWIYLSNPGTVMVVIVDADIAAIAVVGSLSCQSLAPVAVEIGIDGSKHLSGFLFVCAHDRAFAHQRVI